MLASTERESGIAERAHRRQRERKAMLRAVRAPGKPSSLAAPFGSMSLAQDDNVDDR